MTHQQATDLNNLSKTKIPVMCRDFSLWIPKLPAYAKA